jgi:hypothetical protein
VAQIPGQVPAEAEAGPQPEPLYCVYQAGDLACVCYRAVRQDPAQPSEFVSYADLGAVFEWYQLHRAVGVSCWVDLEKATALGRRKRYPLLAEIDLARAEPRMPWAYTGTEDHVTIWAPGALILQALVQYVDIRAI